MTVLECPDLALAADVGLGGIRLVVLSPPASTRCADHLHRPTMVNPGTVIFRHHDDNVLIYDVQGCAEPYPPQGAPTALAAEVVLALTWHSGHAYAQSLPIPHEVGWWLHRPGLNLDQPVSFLQQWLNPDAPWARAYRRARAAPPGLLLLSTVWRGTLRYQAYVRDSPQTVLAVPTVSVAELRW